MSLLREEVIKVFDEGWQFAEVFDPGTRSLGVSSAAPFEGDRGDVGFLAPDRDPPAPIFRIGVFGDGAPSIDAINVAEEVDVFLAAFRGDFEFLLDFGVKAIIGDTVWRNAEVAKDIGGDL